MRRGFSCYLDLVRVIACAIVFCHHLILNYGCYEATSSACRIAARLVPFRAGHSAVIIFFVLSGYVITFVASERETTFREYMLSRCARIYSVAVPVLFLTAMLGLYSMSDRGASAPQFYEFHHPARYTALALAFMTDHWFLAENPFQHGGWWSLSYEVWYYVIFAAAFYSRGWYRWAATFLVLLCVGPKLWALFPCWLMGSVVYRIHRQTHHSPIAPRAARTALICTLSIVVVLMVSGALPAVDRWTDAATGGWLATRMRFSQWFVGDTILAAVFAGGVYAARFAGLDFGALVRPIKYLASITFTFYMIHGMIIAICVGRFGLGPVPTAAAALVGTSLIAMVTEHQKDRLHHALTVALTAAEGCLRRLHTPRRSANG